jgi:hypothetical protein
LRDRRLDRFEKLGQNPPELNGGFYAIRLEAKSRMGCKAMSTTKPLPLLRRMRKWLLAGGVGLIVVMIVLLWPREHIVYLSSKGQPDWTSSAPSYK